MPEEPSTFRAFVLMPFGEAFDPVYSGLLEPALAAAGYEVTRADSVIDQQNVLRDIVTGIERADLVVADLTGLNPNVFYELGIAHGLGIATILITQALDEVPFELRAYRVKAYSTRSIWPRISSRPCARSRRSMAEEKSHLGVRSRTSFPTAQRPSDCLDGDRSLPERC